MSLKHVNCYDRQVANKQDISLFTVGNALLPAIFYYVGNIAESDIDGISKKAP